MSHCHLLRHLAGGVCKKCRRAGGAERLYHVAVRGRPITLDSSIMGKSFLERLARGLGKSTGKLVEKAKEQGLDKKAGELVEKAQTKLKDLVKEFEDGQSEGREDGEAGSGGDDGDEEHTSEGEGAKGEVSEGDREHTSSAGEVSEGDESGANEERREDEPTGKSGGTRDAG